MSITQTSLRKIEKQALEIKELQLSYANLSDEQLKQKFLELRTAFENNRITEDELINPVYAIVCETAKRVLQKDPYKVQVMGAICLNSGDVAAMATGEGKTLASSMPAVLNAITQQSVHIATANEYLAKRDYEEMGRIYNFLGLSVGVVYSGQSIIEKQQAYACDITYGTGSEFGFDYLKDHLTTSKQFLTNQRHGFVIVDEVDSILIDEATIPMIISEKLNNPLEYYKKADLFVKNLDFNDYEIDHKTKNICLTDSGFLKAEQQLGINFNTNENINMLFYINNALTANYILQKNVDYKVEDDQILLIDRHSGRILQGREYSNQLQQAIQTKENVSVQTPSKTNASISFQKYYTKYKKLSGMTGTTEQCEDEFLKNYNMFVYHIPTNKPKVRKDEPMQIYLDNEKLLNAILEEVKNAQKTGQPILIGTTTIEQSESIAELLKAHNISCNVLNANTKKEADIISCAGKLNQVTIATNVAGRGTDIKLGGDPEKLTLLELEKNNIVLSPNEQTIVFAQTFNSTDEKLINARNIFLEFTKLCKQEKQIVNNLGGLRVVSTTLNENQRIKNQLIGRSGRQGDNGSSVVMVSLDDNLLSRFFNDDLVDLKESLLDSVDSNGKVHDSYLPKLLTRAETLCDSFNQEHRNTNLKFENILDPIRTQIYETRMSILKSKKLTETIYRYVYSSIKDILYNNKDINVINNLLSEKFKSFIPTITISMLQNKELLAKNLAEKIIENRKKLLDYISLDPKNKPYLNKILINEKNLILKNLDSCWSEFLNSVEFLQQECFLQAYAQKDPFMEFKDAATNKYQEIVSTVKQNSVADIFNFLQQIKTRENINVSDNSLSL